MIDHLPPADDTYFPPLGWHEPPAVFTHDAAAEPEDLFGLVAVWTGDQAEQVINDRAALWPVIWWAPFGEFVEMLLVALFGEWAR
jgi:hypothetical protein